MYTTANGTFLPSLSQSNRASSASSVPNTAADSFVSTVAGLASVSPQSALSSVIGASPDASSSAQTMTITNPPPASTSSVQSLGLNGSLYPLPNVATVVLAGTSQVIYKQTFTNLQNITAAENITTVLTQYRSQSTSTTGPLVIAPVAVVVGAAGIWYRIGSTGPPIGPPDLPKLTTDGGICKLFPLFCPGTSPPLPVPVPPSPPSPPDSPNNVQNPSDSPDDSGPESEEASQSRGESKNMPSMTKNPTTKATSSAQSQNTRSMSSTQKSTTIFTSSTQPLISFNWVTEIPSPDPVILTTSENTTAMSSYLQAQFTAMGIAFDQEDAMPGVGPVNGTTVTPTFASSGEEESDLSATATSGAGVAVTGATGVADASAAVVATMASMSTVGLASTSATVTATLAADTSSATAIEPPFSNATPTAPPPRLSTPSPINLLACTQL